MRPVSIFLVFFGLLSLVDGALLLHGRTLNAQLSAEAGTRRIVVATLGLTDLALATEARYTRHPAITDPVVPGMDHPGAIEHFPSGSFWAGPATRP